MPLRGRSKEVERNFEDEYGPEGKRVFYATMNKQISKGKTPKLEEARKLAQKRKHHRRKKHRRMT